MGVEDCTRQGTEGAIIDIEVTPGARTSGVCGYDEWRKRLQVKVRERAEKGKANREVVEVMAALLGVDTRDISVVSGGTARTKSVLVSGLDAEAVSGTLEKSVRPGSGGDL